MVRVVSNIFSLNPTQEQNITQLIQACKAGNRVARAQLYRQFYAYAMSICLRYTANRQEAEDIVNDGFVKVFMKMEKQYDPSLSFKAWLRRLMINTAIDHYRKTANYRESISIEDAEEVEVAEEGLSRLSQEEIMRAVQRLPQRYRLVFNLYIVEGYKHHEIADKLGISTGTSKSHLAKARMKLKVWLKQMYGIEHDGQ